MKEYILTPQRRDMFQQLYLLSRLGTGETFPLILPGELGVLQPLLDSMIGRELVVLDAGGYRISAAGIAMLTQFKKRYTDFLQMYDVFSAVDLGAGEFAFAMIIELSSDQFKQYMNQERWEDLRVAVAAYKGLDPLEVVFMSFLNEGRFIAAGSRTGWCIDLVGDVLWDEMLVVCRTALHAEDLGSEDVIQDIITQGSILMVCLLKEAQETAQSAIVRESIPSQEVVTTTTYETITTTEAVPFYGAIGGWGYTPCDYGYVTSPFYIAPTWYEPYWGW